MRRAKEPNEASEPPRPPCGTCGEPATHRVSVAVEPLVLDRDAGTRSVPYWTTNYRGATRIETNLCGECVRKSVIVKVSAATFVEGDKK